MSIGKESQQSNQSWDLEEKARSAIWFERRRESLTQLPSGILSVAAGRFFFL